MSKRRNIMLHINSVLFVVLSLSVIFIYKFSGPIRLWESIKYFGYDLWFYFISLFTNADASYPRLYDYTISNKSFFPDFDLPESFSSFFTQRQVFFNLMFNWWNFKTFLYDSVSVLLVIFQGAYFMFLLYFPLKAIFNNRFVENELSFKDVSRPLERFRKFKLKVYEPIKEYILDLYYKIQHRYYLIPLFIVWGINLNVFAVFFDTFGFLFHFSSSFRLVSIYEFIFTTAFTLYPILSKVPLFVYALIGFWIFKYIQKRMAIQSLYHKDNMNKGFIKGEGVVINLNAPPRNHKTTMLNAFAQDLDEVFRTDFLNIIEMYSALFPQFPWCELEEYIDKKRDTGILTNRYQIKEDIAHLFYVYKQTHEFKFSYDLEEEIIDVGIGNKVIFIQDAMITYAEAYYYYSYDGALVSANFSNRFDSIRQQRNNKFPMWVYPALTIDPYDSWTFRHFSKNIDFDSFRLLKYVEKDNTPPVTDVGVYLEMEASKQWGNQFDNKHYRVDDRNANPLNDGFAMFLSSFAHASLIDYKPFIRYIMDYQRSGDLALKFSGMTETRLTIIPGDDEIRIALPFFYLSPMFYNFLIKMRKKIYTRKYRTYRSDQTLLFNAINVVGSWATKRLTTITNNYAYIVKNVTANSGNDDAGINQFSKKKYFILYKKHYSDRFRSDALKVLYDDASRPGFISFSSFEQLDMSPKDLIYQNSYSFLNKKIDGQKNMPKEVLPPF